MNDQEIQKRCEEFLQQIDVPGFILFGRQEDNGECIVTYSLHKITLKSALLGMLSAVTDLIKRTLP
jgi:hypothetical protein